MSYGRRPFYIYHTTGPAGGVFVFATGGVDDEVGAAVAEDALAQLIATMWRRDHAVDELANLRGELHDLIARGLVVRPDLAEADAS